MKKLAQCRPRIRVETLEDRLAPAAYSVTEDSVFHDGNLGDGIADTGHFEGNVYIPSGRASLTAIFQQAAHNQETVLDITLAVDCSGFAAITQIVHLQGSGHTVRDGVSLGAAGSSIQGLRSEGEIFLGGDSMTVSNVQLVGAAGMRVAGNNNNITGVSGANATLTVNGNSNPIQGNSVRSYLIDGNLNGVSSNTGRNMSVSGTSATVSGNILTGTDNRIVISGDHHTVSGNDVGSILAGGSDYTVQNNDLRGGTSDGAGVVITGTRITVKDNRISGTGHGVTIGDSNDNIVQNNTITNLTGTTAQGMGVFVDGGDNNQILGNTITDSKLDGIRISMAFGNLVKGNIITRAGAGAPNQRGIILTNDTVDPAAAANRIEENTIRNTGHAGINVIFAPSAIIKGNILENNLFGIVIDNNGRGSAAAPPTYVVNDNQVRPGATFSLSQAIQFTIGIVAGALVTTTGNTADSIVVRINGTIPHESIVVQNNTSARTGITVVCEDGDVTVSDNVAAAISVELRDPSLGKTIKIEDNFIGVNRTGSSLNSTGNGLFADVDRASIRRNTIGTLPGRAAAITGVDNTFEDNNVGTNASQNFLENAGNGLEISGDRNLIYHNTFRNNRGHAILVNGNRNEIGSTISGKENTIAANGTELKKKGHAIVIASGIGNEIRRNAINDNAGRGIDLGNDGATINDLQSQSAGVITSTDFDTGANNFQNYPFFIGRDQNGQAWWRLNSMPSRQYEIDFFSNTNVDYSGFGEGQTFLGTVNVTTDDQGHAVFLQPSSGSVLISATATDMTTHDTSEFSMIDSDGDGIANAWETGGIDLDEDGEYELTLNSDDLRRDVFVEVDAMAGNAPLAGAMQMVQDAFAAAPDGGITLHAIIDETNIPVPAGTANQWTTNNEMTRFHALKNVHFGTPAEHGQSLKLEAKKLVYRYCIFADVYIDRNRPNGGYLSGASDPIPGGDFFVSLGHLTPDTRRQAGTFMHELGHSLGLHHGGGGSSPNGAGDGINDKPNYFSVMNYRWQYPYIADPFNPSSEQLDYQASWQLTYSTAALPTLNEAALNELAVIGGGAHRVLQLDDGTGQFIAMDQRVDWSQNGVTGDQTAWSRDVTGDGRITELVGRQDWSLTSNGSTITNYGLSFYFVESPVSTGIAHGVGDEGELDHANLPGGENLHPNLGLTILSSSTSPGVGQTLTYTIDVNNTGNLADTETQVKSTLPANTSFVSAIAPDGTTFSVAGNVVTFVIDAVRPGQTVSLTVAVQVNAGGSLVHNVDVTPRLTDADPADNSKSSTLIVSGPAVAYLVDSASDVDDDNTTAGQLSLREAVRMANANATSDTITFAAGLGAIDLTLGTLVLTDTAGVTTLNGPSGGTQIIRRSAAAGNFAVLQVGAGVSATLRNLTISGGVVAAGSQLAGGLNNLGVTTVYDSTISGNSGDTGGGIRNAGNLSVTRSTISGNSAVQGGGIWTQAPLTMTNSTISGNLATGAGGGLFDGQSGTTLATALTNITLVANRAGAEAGGGLFASNPTVALRNSIVAGNTRASAASDIAFAAGSLSAATSLFNLIGDAASAGGLTHGTSGNRVGDAGTGLLLLEKILNPALLPNGGVTLTHSLVENSLAIAAALATVPDFSAFDQRGAVRDPGFPDIGAYEVQHPLSPVGVPTTYAETFLPRPSADANVAFVKGLYQSTLLRAPDSAGLQGWLDSLARGASRAAVAYGFVNSPENRTNQVTFYYKYFLGRNPDSQGLANWVSHLQSGADEGTVMSGFLLSPEFTGQNDSASFVNLMYYAILGRQADPAGYANWLNALDTGLATRDQVGNGFLRSIESITRVVVTDFGSYLKRTISPEAASEFVASIQSGVTFGSFAAGLLASDEFYFAAGQHLS